MSPRVTRSSARLSAGSSASVPSQSSPPAVTNPPAPPSRKRKATQVESGPQQAPVPVEDPPKKRTRRTRAEPAEAQPATLAAPPPPPPPPPVRRKPRKETPAMSGAGPSSGPSEDVSQSPTAPPYSKRKSNRKIADNPNLTPTPPLRRTRKSTSKANQDATMEDAESADVQDEKANGDHAKGTSSDCSDDETAQAGYEEDDDNEDPFEGSYLSRPPGSAGLSTTLRALSGMMSGISSRLRGILENLKQKEDPSVQLIALQELSEILLVSTEDNLAGHFSSDQYVKELVSLMQPQESGEENPEIMLLACRCIANLMEALPASTASVVYGGAVPILCQKLLEIHFIDLAEQALSTLEKISVEFPSSIVREGGLTACLTYLDFFATSTQRTAVTTAANCCRNIPDDSFPVVRDVMPILLNVLNSSDQRVVEQGCLCVSRVVESFKYQEGKLEELVSPDLLRAILRLLLPGTTNLIGPNIHTQFLRVLAITARASPLLSVELFKMNIVDTLYQILTGVSPPSGDGVTAMKIDSVMIMQALIHRPREQIFETLNVICELLPSVQRDSMMALDDISEASCFGDDLVSLSASSKRTTCQKRLELLEGCKEEVKRFAVILLPTLTEAFSSTVNLNVRQKVLTAQLKMLSNLSIEILTDALRPVPYASYLASILSQQDHPTLVTYALQAAELLLTRLGSIYRYQFYREGVMSEIVKLADRSCEAPSEHQNNNQKSGTVKDGGDAHETTAARESAEQGSDSDGNDDETHEEDDSEGDNDDTDENDDDEDEHDDDASESGSSSSSEDGNIGNKRIPAAQDIITMRARKFIEVHEGEEGKALRLKASSILEDLKALADALRKCYFEGDTKDGFFIFARLADYFDNDALDSITSYELLNSGIVDALLDVFSDANPFHNSKAKATFLQVFMSSRMRRKMVSARSGTVTWLNILVNKLQDLLSRAEHFEVITVHQNSFDSNRSSAASMLAKQLRLKIVADEESGIPRPYRNVMVSIHAIATFKALDDYLRPRISLAERPKGPKSREGLSSAIAAYAAALAGRTEGDGTASASSTVPSNAASNANKAEPRKHPKTRSANLASNGKPNSSISGDKTSAAKKTDRRQQQQQSQVSPLPLPPRGHSQPDKGLKALECADETQISDEDDISEDAALDAIVDNLEKEMEADAPDPSAVNVEVAATGKVTARQEDGTRIATPSQNTTSSRPASTARVNQNQQGPSTPTSLTRPMSYAAAIQSVPQDWHIEFKVDGKPISNDTTIYRAVYFDQAQPVDGSSRNVWSAVHTIKFKRVNGPPPAEPTSIAPPSVGVSTAASTLPLSLSKNPTTSKILRLLSILHELNSNIDDVLSDDKDSMELVAEPVSQFVNTKLTAKLNRQLEEPLIVASNCLPGWSEDLARLYPFLFPFETRHLFLQSTSFGYSRSMTRWQSSQSSGDSRHDHHHDDRPFLGRLQRQKVRISRTRILESAIKVMELYGSSPSILEVEYFEEVGTGLGPTLEFYSTISKEFSKKKLKLWRENDSNEDDEYAFGKRGLFPAPMNEEQSTSENGKRILHLFKILGKFVARSMLDSRIIDVPFNPMFFRVGYSPTGTIPPLGAVRSVDPHLARALRLLAQFANEKNRIEENPNLSRAEKVEACRNIEIEGARLEDLGLDFTLPGYPAIQMRSNSSQVSVTIDNVAFYVERILDLTLGSGVQKQVDAFRAGFSQVFPFSALRAFTPDELVMLFGRVDEDWSLETLMDSIKADHGYNLDSRSVRNLLHTMSELSKSERRDFLQFVTGSPRLPIGGFKSLTPMFTVVCKPSEPPYTSDDYLPSVMTCVNYLKMPDYSSLEILKEKLNMAIREGQGAFHLS